MTAATPAKLRADWIFTGKELIRDAIISFHHDLPGEPGQIVEVRAFDPDEDHSYQQLKGRLLMPGILNAHSHAFQRAIRGRTHTFKREASGCDNFWSWRTQMYRAANAIDPDEIFAISRVAFLEMIRAGYTTVGEFHYLHRSPDGVEGQFARRVIDAAKEVGIHIVLINTAYKTAGPGKPAAPEQERFTYDTLDSFLEGTARLCDQFADDPMVDVAIAAHSVRALAPDAIAQCHAFAVERDLPFHIHACEQRGELLQCREAYGCEPIELLDRIGALTERTSLVHATHLAANDLERLVKSRANVVACPTTERDLGDGFLPLTDLLTHRVPIAVGTDSETVISPFEEIRCLEYHERLLRTARNITIETLDEPRLGESLVRYCQEGGMAALRCRRGFLAPGFSPDFLSINLDHPILWGCTAGEESPDRLGTLLSSVVLSGDSAIVDRVWVGGVERLERLVGDYELECRKAYEEVAYVAKSCL